MKKLEWLSIMFRKKKTGSKAAPGRTESVYLTETAVFGMHRYRRESEDSTVYFVDENRGVRKKLVDSKGYIQNFPGI